MTLDEFREPLAATEPPPRLSHALAGLWWDAKGDWTRANESAQQGEGIEGSWVHAYPNENFAQFAKRVVPRGFGKTTTSAAFKKEARRMFNLTH